MLGQSGIIRAKVVVFGQRWVYSGNKGCIRAPLFYLGKVVVIGQKFLYSGKLVVIGQFGCIRTECFFAQKWLYSSKMVVMGQKLFFLGKSGCI